VGRIDVDLPDTFSPSIRSLFVHVRASFYSRNAIIKVRVLTNLYAIPGTISKLFTVTLPPSSSVAKLKIPNLYPMKK